MLAGVALLVLGVWAWRSRTLENEAFRRHGIDADCVVTSRHVEWGRTESYAVTCGYPVSEGGLEREFKVSRQRHDALPPGSSLPVRYLRSDPTRVRIRARVPDPIDLLVAAALFGTGALMVGGAFLEEGLKRRGAERRLEHVGVVLPGHVVECTVKYAQANHGFTGWILSVTYRLVSPLGEEIFGHERIFRERELWAFPVGAPVHVAFVDERCFRLL